MNLLLEVRYLFRSLLRNRGYSTAVVITLALTIGSNVILFLLLNAVLFRPLPYPHDDALAMLWSFPTGDRPDARPRPVSYGDFTDWQRRSSSFEDMAAFNIASADISEGEGAEQIDGAVVTSNFFAVLGIRPYIGAGLENSKSGDQVVVVSYRLWQSRYRGDISSIGKKIFLSGRPYTLIGVLPPDAEHPEPFWDREVQFWVPMPPSASRLPRDTRLFRVIGRITNGISLNDAQAEMLRIGEQLQREVPNFDSGFTIQVIPLREQLLGKFRAPLLLLMGAALVVLLIACANVTNLQMARMVSRAPEILIRSALGALPGRIILWTWCESCVLAFVGAIFGLLLAFVASKFFAAFNDQVALFSRAKMDFRVVLFTASVFIVVGLLTAVIPVLHTFSLKLSGIVNLRARDQQAGPIWRRLRTVLVSAQISLVLPLLIVSILLGRSFYKLVHVDPGFNAAHVLTFRLSLPPRRYPEPEQTQRFYEDLLDQLRSMAGAHSVALSSGLPLTSLNTQQSRGFQMESGPTSGQRGSAYYRVVDEHYFNTMGIRLVSGRTFEAADGSGGVYVAVVNEYFVKTYLAGVDPIGKNIRVDGMGTNGGLLTIVGVVGNVDYVDLAQQPAPDIYIPFKEDPWKELAIVVRTQISPAALLPAIRYEVQQKDPLLALSDVHTMEDIVFNAAGKTRFALLLVCITCFLAFLLAALGVGALVAHVVADRTREFGIRMALGAQPRDIMRLVLFYGSRLGILGIAIGFAMSLFIIPLVSHFLYGVQGTDLTAFAIAGVLLLASVLAASYLPARHATSIQPASSLRIE